MYTSKRFSLIIRDEEDEVNKGIQEIYPMILEKANRSKLPRLTLK